MRLGTVIGRVTLTHQEPVYRGGRLLLVQPWTKAQFGGAAVPPLPKGSSLVVYDELGAAPGHVVGFTEGAEAAQPFTGDAPVDAYCACIVDQVSYTPPAEPRPPIGIGPGDATPSSRSSDRNATGASRPQESSPATKPAKSHR